MEQKNIQYRSILSIDYHRPFIQVTTVKARREASLHEENIEYVEASPYDFELVSFEAAEIVIPEVEEIEDD
nr:hypothetical protein [Tanacetum cinerariifolium]